MNRDQAVAWLRSVGRNASARDWAMGATIKILVGEPTMAGDIAVYRWGVYLYPATGDAWNLYDCDLPDPAETYESLEAAVHGAHAYIARKEREQQ